MNFLETRLAGAYVVEPERLEDDRGFFARVWCREEFGALGLATEMPQGNISHNRRAGTLRGMHFQKSPHREAKLVRCTRGAVFDVIVDLREDSGTFLEWVGVELTEKNRTMLYVPEGFAHGYLTLEDDAEVTYLVSHPYAPGSEGGIRFDDPAVSIEWPRAEPRVISEKDASWPLLPERGATP